MVSIYYENDQVVEEDQELQDFVKDVYVYGMRGRKASGGLSLSPLLLLQSPGISKPWGTGGRKPCLQGYPIPSPGYSPDQMPPSEQSPSPTSPSVFLGQILESMGGEEGQRQSQVSLTGMGSWSMGPS